MREATNNQQVNQSGHAALEYNIVRSRLLLLLDVLRTNAILLYSSRMAEHPNREKKPRHKTRSNCEPNLRNTEPFLPTNHRKPTSREDGVRGGIVCQITRIIPSPPKAKPLLVPPRSTLTSTQNVPTEFWGGGKKSLRGTHEKMKREKKKKKKDNAAKLNRPGSKYKRDPVHMDIAALLRIRWGIPALLFVVFILLFLDSPISSPRTFCRRGPLRKERCTICCTPSSCPRCPLLRPTHRHKFGVSAAKS